MTENIQHSAGREPLHRRRWFQLLIGFTVSVLCLWWALWQVLDEENAVANIASAFRGANYWWLLAVLPATFAFYLLKARRWRTLLSPLGDFRPLRDLFPPILIGFALNNVLPARLGELVRCLMFARQQRQSTAAVLLSVALERVFDLLSVIAFLALGLLFVEGVDPVVEQSAQLVAAAAGVGIVALSAYVVWAEPIGRWFVRLLQRLSFLPEAPRTLLTNLVESTTTGLTPLRRPGLLLALIGNSLLQWMIGALIVLFALWAFDLQVPLAAAVIVLGVGSLGSALPASPGYFGVVEACFLLVLKLFVSDHETIFAAAIVYHLSIYIPVTAVGLFFLARSGTRFSELSHPDLDRNPTG